jgi:hypothetical protein
MRKTLEFGNLPLIRVELGVAYEQETPLNFDDLITLREALKISHPVVENSPHMGFSALMFSSEIPHFRASNLERGLYIDLNANGIISGWCKTGSESSYPRFPEVCDYVSQACNLFSDKPFKIARIMYHVKPRLLEGFNHWSYISDAYFPSVVAGEVPLYDLAFTFETPSPIRYSIRMSATPISEKEHVMDLVTIGERQIDGTDIPSTFNILHDEMQDIFKHLLTEVAQKDWQYGSS